MITLSEAANRSESVKRILLDPDIGHTDAAIQVEWFLKKTRPELSFTTTEASVRRWRRATNARHALYDARSHAETTEPNPGGHMPGSPLNPLEAGTEPPKMKVLVLDIESTPTLAYVWGMYKENINHDMIVRPSEILCFAASWIDEDEVHVFNARSGYENMLSHLWNFLNDADVVVTFYGKKFDIPKINTQLIIHGFLPYSPIKQVDLCLSARSIFKFESNKLDYVSKRLNASKKHNAGGFVLWDGCMNGDPEAWRKMIEYCRQDVQTTKEVYFKIRPWLTGHPSFAAFSGNIVCPSCGSNEIVRDGFYYTSVSKYPRFVCKCGTWSRSTHRIDGASITGVAL